MINHRELKFGDVPMAEPGGGGVHVHVRTVIADYLQSLETEDLEDSSKLKISEGNLFLVQ